MALKRIFASLMLLLCCSFASANTLPDSGWWWNSSEGGRGYSIEVQDNQIFFAAYTYDPSGSGAPTWYYSGGSLTGDNYYSGRVYKATNGACFGCTQKTPQSTDAGAITISFTSNTTATLTILGTTHQITRFDFTANNDDVLIPTNNLVPTACYGEWTAVIGNTGSTTSTGVYSGDRIQLNTLKTDSATGIKYVSGVRIGNASSVAVCYYEPTKPTWVMNVDYNGTSELFNFKFIGVNLIEGKSWTFPTSGSPTGVGLDFVAFRTASKSFLQNNGGPSTSKSRSSNGNAEKAAAPNVAAQRSAQDKLMATQNTDRSPALPTVVNTATTAAKLINALSK